jgi:hypothetical protein
MNMPGFTAEASLDKTNRCYCLIGTSNSLAGKGEVVPQPACAWDLNDGCYYCYNIRTSQRRRMFCAA